MQLWNTGVASARGAMRQARELEEAGWDGMLVVDSQNLSGDPYVSLALAATASESNASTLARRVPERPGFRVQVMAPNDAQRRAAAPRPGSWIVDRRGVRRDSPNRPIFVVAELVVARELRLHP